MVLVVAWYDVVVLLPPMQPWLDLSRLQVVLPEKLSFCSVDFLFNESSEPQVVLIPRETREQQQQPPFGWPGVASSSFDPDRSTEENYTAPRNANHHGQSSTSTSSTDDGLVGRFAALRRQLDYSYHRVYTPERQHVQDKILSAMLEQAHVGGRACASPPTSAGERNVPQQQQQRWAVFTAGVMGAGKTHTIEWLAKMDRFPLSSFVWVDPDQIRQCLPEFEYLVRYNAAHAGDRTRKEAGMMAELLTLAALEEGTSVLVDGSLRDVEWYNNYFALLRHKYPGIRIAIFHVTAPHEAVLERAAVRSLVHF